jgi:hypothetical protein
MKTVLVAAFLVVAGAMPATTLGGASGVGATAITATAPPATPAGIAPSLPPTRVADCINFALLDDMCTKQWYTCKRGGSELAGCIDAWETCCTLRGQGTRSRLGSPEAVSSNR